MTEQVLEGFFRWWNGFDGGPSHLPRQVPGGVWHERMPIPTDNNRYPYAAVAIKDLPRIDTSGTAYIQNFQLTVTIYAAPGQTTQDIGGLKATIEKKFKWNTTTFNCPSLPAGAGFMGIKQLPGELHLDTKRRQAQDVPVASVSWEVMMQGNDV